MEVTFTGWVAVLFSILMTALGVMMICVSIFGGYIKYESEGLIPKIKRWKRERKEG